MVIQTKTISIETNLNGIVLKGKLEYSSKNYCIKLIEPIKAETGYRLIYIAPVKYVYEKSKNPTCYEIELKDESIEILKFLYLNSLNQEGKNNE